MSEEDPGPIPIDIVGDFTCPFCYLGLRLVNAVVGSVPGLAVDIRWYPYQIDPRMPPGGMLRFEYLSLRHGAEKTQAMFSKAQAEAQAFGFEFAFDKIKRQPNTLQAHRLARFAYNFGMQTQVVERLFQGFFLQGLDIEDRGVLITIAAKARLDPAAVEEFLNGSDDVPGLRQEIEDIRAAGVDEVPRFTFAGKQDIIGLKPAEVFADALFNSIPEG